MKKFICLLTMLCAPVVTSGLLLQAQTIGENFTSYVNNPGFEGGSTSLNPPNGKFFQPEGWTLTYDVPGWPDIWSGPTNDPNTPVAEGTQFFNAWATDIVFIDLWQKIKLPKGGYELSAKMRMTGGMGDISNQHIYAEVNGKTTESKILTEEGTGNNWERLKLIFVSYGEDSVRIGAYTSSDTRTTRGWFQLDDVRITYCGDAHEVEVDLLQTKLFNLNEELQNLTSDDIWMTSGSVKLIGDADIVFGENSDSREIDKLQSALDSLGRIKEEILLSIDLLESFDILFQEENELANADNVYPGIDAFKEALDVALPYLTGGTTPDGGLVYSQELEKAIEDLETADRVYRLTQPASADAPADYTWMIQSPTFTKRGGDTARPEDAVSTGWQTNNVMVGGDCKLAFINNKNCWNNWSDNFTTMDVYQELTGVPEGIYTVQCNTTTDAPVTTNHLYARSTASTAVSPTASYWYNAAVEGGNAALEAKWETLETEKVFVANDGKLRIGFASTWGGQSSQGWFCLTDVVLKYYGPDADGYENALDQKIREAEGMCDSLMLKADLAQLKNAIVVGKAAKGQGIEKINAAYETMNKAMEVVPFSYSVLKAYNNNELAAAKEADNVLIYEASKNLTKDVIAMQNAVIENDTTTYLAMSVLRDALSAFNSYIKIYDEALLYTSQTDVFKAENIQKLTDVLATEESAIKKGATKEAINTMAKECRAAINALRATEEFADNTDLTYRIVNPNIETPNNDTCPSGWEVAKHAGGTYAGSGYACTGDPEDHYLDSWGDQGRLRYTAKQTITGLPNGTYRLEAIGRASGEGAFLYAVSGDTLKTEIPNMDDKGGDVWLNAPDGSAEKMVNDGKGYGWSYLTIDNIMVSNNLMEIGCTTDSVFSHKPWTGWWFSVDSFKLTYLNSTWNVGLEDIQAGNQGTPLIAYAENGYIIVKDVDDYTITTLTGIPVSLTEQQAPGIYIVKAGARSVKVIVK